MHSTAAANPRPFRLTGDSPIATGNPRSARSILLALGLEWAQLCRQPGPALTLRRWAQTEPLLTASSLSGLLAKIDESSRASADAILLALIRLAQDGDQLAGRILLQAMLPKLARIVATFRQLNGSDMRVWPERQQLAVATFWTVIHAYPAQRRTSRVAANLALETLHRLTAELRSTGARRRSEALPLADRRSDGIRDDVEYFNVPTMAAAADTASTGRDAATADLVDLAIWGLRTQAITTYEAQLLIDVYLPHPDADRDPATARALSPAALRKRCSRARQKLIDAVRADTDGWALAGPTALPSSRIA